MTSEQKKALDTLLKRVFARELSNVDFLNEASEILELKKGDAYPKFIWKADHYLTDEDLCRTDLEYEENMRKDIMSSFKSYL